MDSAFITGISGFAGSHLADYILTNEPKIRVHGLVRSSSPKENIKNKHITLHEGDLQDPDSIYTPLKELRPKYIFHLAAKTYVKYSFRNPITCLQDNCIGTINLLEALRKLKEDYAYNPRTLICSTSEVYGKVNRSELPIKETNPLRPMSPYAVSKVAEDLYANQYFASWGLDIVISRAFSHSGPRRNPTFVLSNFCKQFAEMMAGVKDKKLLVGNLDSVRTFADVADIVRGYWVLAEKGRTGETYNICGNNTVTIAELIDKISAVAGFKPEIVVDQDRLRPSDVVVQIPDCSKFTKETGWMPNIPLSQTIASVLEYWTIKLKAEAVLTEYGI